jgi:hypothetical protein
MPHDEQKAALKFRRWVVQSNKFHFAMKSLVRGDWETSLAVLRMLRAETALIPAAFRWLASANGHTIARPELVRTG